MLATARLATREPAVVGSNVTFVVQLAFGATLLHVLVWLNALALAPITLMLLIARVPVPVLVSVTL